jgi:hypothetical protein
LIGQPCHKGNRSLLRNHARVNTECFHITKVLHGGEKGSATIKYLPQADELSIFRFHQPEICCYVSGVGDYM